MKIYKYKILRHTLVIKIYKIKKIFNVKTTSEVFTLI